MIAENYHAAQIHLCSAKNALRRAQMTQVSMLKKMQGVQGVFDESLSDELIKETAHQEMIRSGGQ